MTNREELQRIFWLALRDLGLDRAADATSAIDTMLDAADQYAAGSIPAGKLDALDAALTAIDRVRQHA